MCRRPPGRYTDRAVIGHDAVGAAAYADRVGAHILIEAIVDDCRRSALLIATAPATLDVRLAELVTGL